MSLFQTLKEFFRHHLIFLLIQTGLKGSTDFLVNKPLPYFYAGLIVFNWDNTKSTDILTRNNIWAWRHSYHEWLFCQTVSDLSHLWHTLPLLNSAPWFKHFPLRTTLALIVRCIAIILCFDLRRKLWVQFNFISIFHCFISNEV